MAHHKRKHCFKKIWKKEYLGLIAGCIGIGMILVIILPFWAWIAIVSVSLIVYAVSYYYH